MTEQPDISPEAWASELCSAHRTPNPLCRICNPVICALSARVQELEGEGEVEGPRRAYRRLKTRFAALEAENVELREDKARLDWFTEEGGEQLYFDATQGWCAQMDSLWFFDSTSIRAAIDAARAAK